MKKSQPFTVTDRLEACFILALLILTVCCGAMIPRLFTGFETGGMERITSGAYSKHTRTVLDIDPHIDLPAITKCALRISESSWLRFFAGGLVCLALLISPMLFPPKVRGWFFCGTLCLNLLFLIFQMMGIFALLFVL
jgi:hypothetical protein